ncbi:ATP-binding protein [Leeuwenhoekiella parthenopeia]|uniref:ATP-binding protein n=1 Tax=Leeuwenhoekiella parthenopeia TaxID=2890320 RepID=A0ABS8GU86_9FLAO|nr:ATP-binding protein [Leeuwenhoekiella parthenopeia]MCC4213575.1 ATP-binding protein [Leeuwenhoekiella parthenopeia]
MEFKPHIGKNVIETLTLGMYEDARFIYREYVQNAADQIDIAVEQDILNSKDEGLIDIHINRAERSITIFDNATGIENKNVYQFLGDVANSQKDRNKRKGFRGIGRLGGLGYCEKLVFETSYVNEEVKNTITLNAKSLKRIIEDKTDTSDAATVIRAITSFEQQTEQPERHYFKVCLINVTNDLLLDEVEVQKYLSIVAPVPFRKDFKFSEKIYRNFNKRYIKIEEYDVQLNLNNEKLFKPYKNTVHSKTGYKPVEIIDVEFIEILNSDGELIALGWYGVSDLLNNIIHQDDYERGFRIRNDNIQIGSENTLNGFFKEDRFNHHFIGEIHTFGYNFKPNARRDYFNENKVVTLFEEKLKKEFGSLYKIAHQSSDIHSCIKKIELYNREKENFESTNFRSKNEEIKKKRALKPKFDKAKMAITKLNKIAVKAEENEILRKIYNQKVEDESLFVDDMPNSLIQYVKPKLSKLSKQKRNLVYEVFEILEKNLDIDNAENIKEIIAEKYN